MRVLGRLAFAAALLVPIGVAVASPAGASVGKAVCTGGAVGSVTAAPGLLLTTYAPQTLKLASSVTCTGGFVSGGAIAATFQTVNVRCGTLVGKAAGGTATVTWATADHAGQTTAKLNFKIITSANHVSHATLTGSVTTTGSNLFAGKPVTGTVDLTKALTSGAGTGTGDCFVTQRLKTLPISAITLNIG